MLVARRHETTRTDKGRRFEHNRRQERAWERQALLDLPESPLTASTGPLSTSGARYCASLAGARFERPMRVKCPSAPSGVGNDRREA